MQESIKIKTSNRAQAVSGAALGLGLLAGVSCFLQPFVPESSYASDSDLSVAYSAEDWVISTPVSTAASSGGLNFALESSASGTHVALKDTVSGGSTNVPDYQIYVSVNTTDGQMPLGGSDYTHAIAATSGTVTDATDSTKLSGAAALSTNSWGYALSNFNSSINYNDLVSSSTHSSWSNSKWSKLPYISTASLEDESTVESTAAKIYDSSTSGDSVDIYYAVQANNNLASGEYKTTVTYTLVGEAPAGPIVNGMYMQDVTPANCAATPTYSESNTTYTIKDKRDENEYQVRKLEDGHCWMVTNLRLGKTTAMRLYSTDTDFTTNDISDGYWDLPASSGGNGNPSWNSSYDTAYMHIGTTSDCYSSNCWTTAWGNYYNWTAVTAGLAVNTNSGGGFEEIESGGNVAIASVSDSNTTDDNEDSGTSRTSICPKGWKLPEDYDDTEYSWNYLLFTGYNADEDSFRSATNTGSGYWSGAYGSSGLYNPLSTSGGPTGYWWSHSTIAVPLGADNIFILTTDNDDIIDQHFADGRNGYSVRCVFVGS